MAFPNREQWYTLVQVTITISLVAATIFLAVTNRPIPELLNTLTTMAVGYFVGSQVEQRVMARLR